MRLFIFKQNSNASAFVAIVDDIERERESERVAEKIYTRFQQMAMGFRPVSTLSHIACIPATIDGLLWLVPIPSTINISPGLLVGSLSDMQRQLAYSRFSLAVY